MLNEWFGINYIILLAIWTLWCVLHSLMISQSFTEFMKCKLKINYRFYRLIFNVVSILTVIPVVLYSHTIQSKTIFHWDGYWIVLQLVIVIISLFLFYAGAKHYDFLQFLGIRQIASNNAHSVLSESGEIDKKGIMCVTRHPWYLGAILIIWARDLSYKTILVNIILTMYLIIGTLLEERKLIKELGDEYRSYQKQVSMLFPIKWIKRMFN